MKFLKEFFVFIREYKVAALAIAFIMGVAATALVKSLVDNIIMPLIGPLLPSGGWQNAVLNIGPIALQWGAFLAEVVNFIIIALVVFMVAKYVMKEEQVTKK